MNNPFIFDERVLPPYDEYDRTFVLADGTRIPELEYHEWRNRLKRDTERNIAKANMEFKLKCIDSSEIMCDILKGYAPSIALKRSHNKLNQ